MKAAFAILANAEVHNWVRKLAWAVHTKYRTGIDASRLPPHVSLKQAFAVADIAALEQYMDGLASRIHPFEVHLTGLQIFRVTVGQMETGVLYLDVEETEVLRGLHNQINRELSLQFGDTRAPFDGPEYHFHMTVEMGGQPFDTYRRIYDEFRTLPVDLRYTAQELVMFVYDEQVSLDWGYMTYKILPLSGKAGQVG